jgi:uncharacterized protein YebE (UPF0316 family)
MGGNWFDYVILPLLIFLARIVDVSLDTIRVILVAKGYRKIAPFIGFFQVLVWIITITRIMANLDNWMTYIAYAAGFATGTYIGMRIEGKIALGYELIRIITRQTADSLIYTLRDLNYPVTSVRAMGRDGDVDIIFVVIQRKRIAEVTEIIKQFNPKAFYTIEDVRFVSHPVYMPRTGRLSRFRYRPM